MADAAARVRRAVHQALRRVTDDVEGFRFNTAIAALMECTNALGKLREEGAGETPEWRPALRTLVLMLAPLTPHLAEELWARLGEAYSVHRQPWPTWDPDAVRVDTMTVVLQVNGRVRDRVTVPAGLDDVRLREAALGSDKVRKFLDGKSVEDVIVVPGKLVNVVAR
jgi:leucyl-tRNA synthetase